MKTMFAILALALLASSARSQPVTQTYSVLMCPTGQVDANQNPIVFPCGNALSPVITTIVGAMPTQQFTQCPPNPLTRKTPPLC